MHPRNPYRTPPDFFQLAKSYPPLEPCLISVSGGHSIDFKDENSQRRLTEALLHRDFNISLNVPPNRLCPPVPNRLNYVLWIQDILRATGLSEGTTVLGLDIGTGASAIYPLLSCSLNPTWSFIATDVDKVSLSCARSNAEKNGLSARIQICETTPQALIFSPLQGPDIRVDFTMCNPPFYSSHEDVAASAEAKEFEPNAVCTGADVEMITEGGESAFVGRMVIESVDIGTRCRWYTSMLGKMSSLTQIVTSIREHSIENYGITEFVQGSTRRWAIVWSFDDSRLPDVRASSPNSAASELITLQSVARITNPQIQNLMPPRNTLRQPVRVSDWDAEHLNNVLASVLAAVEGTRVAQLEGSTENPRSFVVYASSNTWSRAARRKQKRDPGQAPAAEVNLVCSLRWILPDPDADSESLGREVTLECQWVRGKDRSLFEGFASHVSRKVTEAVAR
ncbi:S-adenosyl-L-methionine-dependent methyltransferase [Favolaschia claudopus]|uniref:S-adenosyl-L-methionine-dependent methyltransferase n=1 Tax=Favolaschia claudopus TaxID=2862362 RepID=A0AAW0D1D3_9AGAR